MFNRTQTTAAALALVLAGTGAAHASTDFTGAYLGAQGGWTIADADTEIGDDSYEGLAVSGPAAHALAGSSFMQGDYLLALEAHVGTASGEFSSGNGQDFTLESGLSWGLTGRVGRLVADNTAIYGLLGWQVTEFEAETVNGGRASEKNDLSGPRLGVGFEMVNEARMFLRLEYSATVYRSRSFDLDGLDVDVDPVGHQFLVGGGYRF